MNNTSDSSFVKFQRSVSSGVRTLFSAWALLAVLVTVSRADGTKPPSTGELYSYEGTLNLSELKPDTGVTASITDLNGTRMIKVDFSNLKGYPGVNFPVPAGGWDLRGFTGTQIVVHNPGTDNITVTMKVENPAGADRNPWNAEVLTLNPGETQTLKVIFGKSFKRQGFPLDPARVAFIKVFVQALTHPASIIIGKPMVFKGGAADAAPAAAKVSVEPPPSQTYVTTTTSPSNHSLPYGQQWELVKDWTFGKKRADATIHNKSELDKEFYYRYIYDNAKLDILPTYWSYHRDYPEGDARSLHVFGDDTLTLKARIPEGGGLRLRGIES